MPCRGGSRGDRRGFEAAQEQDEIPLLRAYFEIYPYGHLSEFRSFGDAKSALKSDFTLTLINEVPRVFFDPAPVMVDDPLANGSKYDVMMKIRDNVDGYAVVILLNDPDSSFIDYVGTHPGADWQKIMGGGWRSRRPRLWMSLICIRLCGQRSGRILMQDRIL